MGIGSVLRNSWALVALRSIACLEMDVTPMRKQTKVSVRLPPEIANALTDTGLVPICRLVFTNADLN